MLILEICFCIEVSKKRGVLNLLFAARTLLAHAINRDFLSFKVIFFLFLLKT